MIELDGSYNEGGGALIRVALALSTLTGKSFKVTNIRAGRPRPGLKAQHLTAINALKEICNAKTNDIELGSTELTFVPGEVKRGKYEFDIGTAGSISLLLQAIILPAMFAPGKVTLTIKGGTCGKWQASVDYIRNVLFPHLLRFVDKIELKTTKRGYYPKGGGEVTVEINPRFQINEFPSDELSIKTAKIDLNEQGELEQIRGLINLSLELQDKDVGERIKKAAEDTLPNVPKNISVQYVNTKSIGGEIVLWALFSQNGKMSYDNPIILGSDELIEQGKSSEKIGQNAAKKLLELIKTGEPVDHHLADQLIMFMGLLPGSSITPSKITNHTNTNIYVVEKFLNVGFKTNKTISVESL